MRGSDVAELIVIGGPGHQRYAVVNSFATKGA